MQKGCNNLPNLNALQLTEKEKACLINFNPEQQRRVAQASPKTIYLLHAEITLWNFNI